MSDAKPKPYPFDTFEPAWQARWDAEKTFHTPNPGEPGFDPAKGYRQAATIGAILGKSIQDLKDDEKRMDGAIERLEQLLNSLPEPTPASPATPKRKSNRKS